MHNIDLYLYHEILNYWQIYVEILIIIDKLENDRHPGVGPI
jgi:hypothetical protein